MIVHGIVPNGNIFVIHLGLFAIDDNGDFKKLKEAFTDKTYNEDTTVLKDKNHKEVDPPRWKFTVFEPTSRTGPTRFAYELSSETYAEYKLDNDNYDKFFLKFRPYTDNFEYDLLEYKTRSDLVRDDLFDLFRNS